MIVSPRSNKTASIMHYPSNLQDPGACQMYESRKGAAGGSDKVLIQTSQGKPAPFPLDVTAILFISSSICEVSMILMPSSSSSPHSTPPVLLEMPAAAPSNASSKTTMPGCTMLRSNRC